jgi:hypothetical protein
MVTRWRGLKRGRYQFSSSEDDGAAGKRRVMRVCGGAGEGPVAGLGCAAALHSHQRRQSRHMQKPCYASVNTSVQAA